MTTSGPIFLTYSLCPNQVFISFPFSGLSSFVSFNYFFFIFWSSTSWSLHSCSFLCLLSLYLIRDSVLLSSFLAIGLWSPKLSMESLSKGPSYPWNHLPHFELVNLFFSAQQVLRNPLSPTFPKGPWPKNDEEPLTVTCSRMTFSQEGEGRVCGRACYLAESLPCFLT